MADKNYLNLHVLISHSPSCLNRDDMNMQKSAVFGGVRRVRISSQCLKRAMRESEHWQQALGAPSVRTRELGSLKENFKARISDPALAALVEEAIDRIAGAGAFAKAKPAKVPKSRGKGAEDSQEEPKEAGREKAAGVAVAPWSIAEVEKMCGVLAAAKKEGLKDEKLSKRVEEASKPLLDAFSRSGMDIALFGRMATSGLMRPVDGAMSLGHVITTHAVDADLDWFTAMDDLTEGKEEAGAGHLNTQEFGAGVFYRYASLNIRQLQENLGGAPRPTAMDVAAHFARMLATVVPDAKQRSFAAHNLADFVLASLTDIPISGANAFESPVRAGEGGFMLPSVKAFEGYLGRVYKGYGLGEQHAVFSLHDSVLEPRMATLDELEDWIRKQ